MAVRIPWDKYETAILIEACADYNNNRITKKDAIRRVSKELRQKAVDEGKIIDDLVLCQDLVQNKMRGSAS